MEYEYSLPNSQQPTLSYHNYEFVIAANSRFSAGVGVKDSVACEPLVIGGF